MKRGMATRNIDFSQFYCTQCGKRGLDLPRKKGQGREAGHLKKLWCPCCNKEVNFCEIKPFTKYTYEDFKVEFEYNNFNEEGLRIRSYGELKEMIRNGELEKSKTLADVRDPWIR